MAGLALSHTSTHHGDVVHVHLVLLGRRAGLCGGLLLGGAGEGSILIQGQVGIADVILQGLRGLGEKAQVPLLRDTSLLLSWAPPHPRQLPLQPSLLSPPHCLLLASLFSGCFQHPTSVLPGLAAGP